MPPMQESERRNMGQSLRPQAISLPGLPQKFQRPHRNALGTAAQTRSLENLRSRGGGKFERAQGGGTISASGSQAFTTGTAGSISQSANTILDRFMQIPPTITIREGHRVKIYFTQDMLLPAYTNHTIPQTF